MRTSSRGPDPEPAPERDVALTGAPTARRVYREIAADPAAAVRLDVIGPGGSGKSTLLDTLTELYRQSGAEVIRELAALPEGGDPPDAAILVDDAHELADEALARLTALARGNPVRLVVAHRPWPHTPAMSALGVALTRRRPPVVLGTLDRAGVAGRAALLLGERPEPELVEGILQRTGGLPSLVDRLLHALRSTPEPGLEADPPGLLEQISYEVSGLPEEVGDLLLAVAVGAPLDADVLGPALDVLATEVSDLVEAARAAGLLGAEGTLAPLVQAAVLADTPALRVQAVRQRLAEVQLERGGRSVVIARGLLGTAVSGERVAAVFTAAGDDALRAGDPIAAEYYAAAVRAGAAAGPLAARRGLAAAAAGDFDTALTLADQALADRSEQADHPRAVAVAATVAAQRGMPARSAELYRWLATERGSLDGDPDGSVAAAAVPALLGVGALDEARALLDAPAAGGPGAPPTLLSGAEQLIARGVYESVAGSPTGGLSLLARAAALLEPAGAAVVLPDTPAALAALVALQCGELDVAASTLDRAVHARLGGPAAAARHRLLQAWIAMQRGATGRARAVLTGLGPSGAGSAGRALEPRDEFLAAALEVALARRAGEIPALMVAWSRAREAIVRYPVDLYAVAPLGELVVGAARLREQGWVQPHLIEAQALLARLGEPPLWAAPLRWAGLQASVVVRDSAAAEQHASALEKDIGAGRYVAALATAARLWLRLLADDVDAAAVEAGARGLHAVGLTWEGGRLAGQAAIRTRDRKDMTALLSCARALQGGAGAAEAAPAQAEPAPSGTRDSPDGTLSDREKEVAELVLAGLTYKQIGEQLFISAKTVEHHVARMRQRLGSESRGELFARLRSLIGTRD